MEPARRKLVLLIVVLGVAIAALWQRQELQRLWRRTLFPMPAPILVMLPLQPTPDSAADEAFARGVTRDITARLGQIPGVKVLGRSGLTRHTEVPLDDLLRAVDASAAIIGTVSRSGDDVRIDLEIIRGKDVLSVWGGHVSGGLKDIVALEAQAASRVAAALKVNDGPSPSNERALTRQVDPKAYELHAGGQDALAREQPTEALDLFNQAAAADPTLAEAWGGIAEAIRAIDVNEGVPDDPARLARLREAAAHAVEIDPDSAQANFAKGLAAPALDDSLISLKRSTDIDTSFAIGLEALGDAVRDIDPERSLAFYGRALVADTFLETARINEASTNLLLNRWGLAQGGLLKVVHQHAPPWSLAMFPVFDFAKDSLGDALADLMIKTPMLRERPYSLAQLVQTLARQHKTEEALKEGAALLERFPDDCEGRAAYAGVLADAGRAPEAQEIAAPLLARAEGENVRGSALRCAVLAAAGLGDAARTAAILERIESREEWLRAWSFARLGQSGRLLLMGHTYPLTKVVGEPALAPVRARFDTAAEAKRLAIREFLGPVAYQ